MLQGDADDYVGGEQRRHLAAELRTAGAPLELHWLKGAGHLLDGPSFAPAVFRPRAQTLQAAQIVEGNPGLLRNSVTGEPFRWSDPQVGHGATGRWRPFWRACWTWRGE